MNRITICGYKGCNNKAEYGPCSICVFSIMKDREEGKKDTYCGPFTYRLIGGGWTNPNINTDVKSEPKK